VRAHLSGMALATGGTTVRAVLPGASALPLTNLPGASALPLKKNGRRIACRLSFCSLSF
jgi:hypothetical protein